MKKRAFALILFIAGISMFLFRNSTITGNFILERFELPPIQSLIGLVLIIFSLLIFVSRKNLDAIVIPTGGGSFDSEEQMYTQDRNRAETAVKNIGNLERGGYFVISGYKGKKVREGQSYSIYKYLRRHGIKPSQMILEGESKDTLENVIYTLREVKRIEEKSRDKKPWNVAFVSYPGHLKRFEDFEEQAIKRGLFKKGDFRFHKIPTQESPRERGYENNPLRRISHFIKLLTIERYRQR